jgi:hypothetical protein
VVLREESRLKIIELEMSRNGLNIPCMCILSGGDFARFSGLITTVTEGVYIKS